MTAIKPLPVAGTDTPRCTECGCSRVDVSDLADAMEMSEDADPICCEVLDSEVN